jgi:Leucine-rich repeat (LRR) protein
MAGTDVNDDSTKYLAKFTALRGLLISDTDLTSKCIGQIIKVPTLERLVMNRTLVTDLSGLGKLKHLYAFDAQANHLNDQALKEILICKSITSLNLRKTSVTDNFFLNLKSFPLTRVDVAETKLTDKGVHYLAAIPTLKYLDMNTCDITNSALSDLAKLPQLRYLNVQSTHVDATGIEYFKRIAKNCIIEGGPHIPKGHEGVHF